jgi:hypothetical protein
MWDQKLLLLHGFQDARSRNAAKHAKCCPFFPLILRHNTVVFIENVPLKTDPLAPCKRIGFKWNTLYSMTIWFHKYDLQAVQKYSTLHYINGCTYLILGLVVLSAVLLKVQEF